jgi:hypothetical protein
LKKLGKKFLDPNENENKTYQSLWDMAKAVLRGTITAMNSHNRK